MARILTLAAALAALLAPAAQAAGPERTARALDRQMRLAGGSSGAYVVDLDSGRTLYSRAASIPRVPASVNKLYTTAAALERFGPDEQFETEVLGARPLDSSGVLKGNLYLRGGGDPTFDTAQARGLARVLAGSGLTAVTGRVVGDESRFDSLRGGPASSYRTSTWVGPLSALTYNRGFTAGRKHRFQRRPAVYAARRFKRALRQAGVKVGRRAPRAGTTPASAVTLGEWASPRIDELIARTNTPSDNFIAETLLKDLGAEFGDGGTTAAGAAVARSVAARFDARPRMVDGSGLSHSNATSPVDVVRLLSGMEDSEPFYESLAVAGRTGTLADRMEGSRAQDRCRAKTGTLIGVSALAGYCTGRRGARVAFAFLMNGVSIWGAHQLQDRMANVLTRYRP